MQGWTKEVPEDPRLPLKAPEVWLDAGRSTRKSRIVGIGLSVGLLALLFLLFSDLWSSSSQNSSDSDSFQPWPLGDNITYVDVDFSKLSKIPKYPSKESKNWDEASHAPLAYRHSRGQSDAKKRLFVDNLQHRPWQHLGKEEDGFVRVNEHNNRIKTRRNNMKAFDKIRVDYCGEIFPENDKLNRINGEANGWVKFMYSDMMSINSEKGTLQVSYAKNSIDYSISYNDNMPTYTKNVREQTPEEEMRQIRKKEQEIEDNLEGVKSVKYKVNRYICERKWGKDAPSGEYSDATVTVERLGPFFSHGNYDWNSVRFYSNAGNMTKLFPKHLDPEEIFLLGTFFQPTWKNGTLISYPPLHVHHTHLHPYGSNDMDKKLNPEIAKINETLHALMSEESREKLFEEVIDTSRISDETKLAEIKAEFMKRADEALNERRPYLDEIIKRGRDIYISHHVVLQGHGDAECTVEQGGSDCVLHLLKPGFGYKVSDSSQFSGNFEINDVRDTKEDFDDYFSSRYNLDEMKDYFYRKPKDQRKKKDEATMADLSDADDNIPRHKSKGKSGGRDLSMQYKELEEGLRKYVSTQNEIEYYIDIGLIWAKKPRTETTFLQFGNPPTGFAWMTYMFPLDRNTNFMFYNYTNWFMGPGELSNFILHTHMVYTDSIYVFKGDNVYSTLLEYVEDRDGSLPFVFECHDETLTSALKDKLLKSVTDTGGELVCEGAKPTLVLYCDKEDDENCIYRDRRIDFNCQEKIRLEAFETLIIVAFNKVRGFTTHGDAKRVDSVDTNAATSSEFKSDALREETNNVKSKQKNSMNLNGIAIASSFGYSFAAHQHSFFRGDFVSDAAKENKFTRSYGRAEVDVVLGNFAPAASFNYGFWKHNQWERDQKDEMLEGCSRNDISFEAFLPWENLYYEILDGKEL